MAVVPPTSGRRASESKGTSTVRCSSSKCTAYVSRKAFARRTRLAARRGAGRLAAILSHGATGSTDCHCRCRHYRHPPNWSPLVVTARDGPTKRLAPIGVTTSVSTVALPKGAPLLVPATALRPPWFPRRPLKPPLLLGCTVCVRAPPLTCIGTGARRCLPPSRCRPGGPAGQWGICVVEEYGIRG